mmetsp:Transcript_31520/g.102699  ORF Transcript_31520/g.102699 Transcript_31520/m.102699 type:complete len:412 (-) Transcript_31520:1875-3110(-)
MSWRKNWSASVMRASAGCGSSTMAYLMEETTVLRTVADWSESRSRSAGSTRSGATSTSRPRHSATTLRAPSSSLPVCAKSSISICSTSGADITASASPGMTITSLSAWSRKYWYFELAPMAVKSGGRNWLRLPAATLPMANDVANLSSSLPSVCSVSMSICWRPCSKLRSCRFPISPMQKSATSLEPSSMEPAWSIPARLVTVAFTLSTPAAPHRAATQMATERLVCLIAMSDTPFCAGFPAESRSCFWSASNAACGAPLATEAAKKLASDWSAAPWSRLLWTSLSAAGSTCTQTTAEEAGARRTVLVQSVKARLARWRSASVTSAAASVTIDSTVAGWIDAACFCASESSPMSDASLSERFALRKKLVSSIATGSTMAAKSSGIAQCDTAVNALTAVSRVTSLRRRSMST